MFGFGPTKLKPIEISLPIQSNRWDRTTRPIAEIYVDALKAFLANREKLSAVEADAITRHLDTLLAATTTINFPESNR